MMLSNHTRGDQKVNSLTAWSCDILEVRTIALLLFLLS